MNKYIDYLKKASIQNPINIVQFNDSIANKTEWTPLKKGGASFGTHNLVEVNQRRLKFKPSVFAIVFYLIFTMLGLGLLGTGFFLEYQLSFEIHFENIILIFMGVIFFTAGTTIGYAGTQAIVFDKKFGFFWKGRKKPNRDIEYSHPEWFTPLSDIHALQIISEYVKGNKSSYYSYELNLVFRDGKRENVIDHGDLKKMRQDTETISRFLNKPVWDATALNDKQVK